MHSGSIELPSHWRKAYVAQEPTLLLKKSIRDNIIYFKSFDKDLYERVLDATALTEDLNRKPGHDSAPAENLSGGQKQRVCLARALYAQAEIVLLDDCFSALDPLTAEACWRGCFGPDGLLKTAAVVLGCGDRVPFASLDIAFELITDWSLQKNGFRTRAKLYRWPISV